MMYKALQYILTQKQRRAFAGFGLLSAFGALLDTFTTVLMLPLMNAIINPERAFTTSWSQKMCEVLNIQTSSRYVVTFSIFIAALYVFRGLYRFFLNWTMSKFKIKAQMILTDRLFRGYVFQPYSYHLHTSSAEIMQSVTQDVGRTFTVVMSLLAILSDGLMMVFLLTVLLFINPMLTLLAAILIVVLLFVVNRFISKSVKEAGREIRKRYVRMFRGVNQGLGGIKSIKTNKREAYFSDKYAADYQEYSNYSRRYSIISRLPHLTVETVSMAGCFIIVAVVAARATLLPQALPVLVTFAVAAMRLMPAATKINSAINELRFAGPYVMAVYQSLQTTDAAYHTSIQQSNEATAHNLPHQPLLYGVEARDISFTYPEQQQPLYQKANFFIEAGKATALMGPTGGGKTTLADLFLGLLQPDEGVILADGHNIAENPYWWASQVGYVPQHIFLTEGSVRENVAFGYPLNQVDDEWVWECLKDANIDTFVRALPQGLDTSIGERGVRISGGQQQRIGIARALFSRPWFLVLDEATSSLDSDTEQVIMDAIYNLSGKKTLLIIAHRLSTIERCHKVYKIPAK